MATQIILQEKKEAGIRDGAIAFQSLFREIYTRSNETVFQFGEDGAIDGRDYVGIAAMVATSIQHNMVHATPALCEGYLRALTDLLCMSIDGCTPSDGWNPIENTALAFDAARAAINT